SEPQPLLFAPGPLAQLAIAPAVVEVAPGGERRVSARAKDADGRTIRDALAFAWTIEGNGFSVVGDGARPAVSARGDLLPGADALLALEARQGDRVARATARVVVVAERARDRSGPGIPKPELVDASGAVWRSRMAGE